MSTAEELCEALLSGLYRLAPQIFAIQFEQIENAVDRCCAGSVALDQLEYGHPSSLQEADALP